jgi:hypothetical protein
VADLEIREEKVSAQDQLRMEVVLRGVLVAQVKGAVAAGLRLVAEEAVEED